MAKVLTVVSGKGGVGKTTVTANVGAALAAMGHKVLLIDGDIGLRNLDIVLGMQDEVVFHFFDVMTNKCSHEKAIVTDSRFRGLSLLAAPQFGSFSDIDKAAFVKMVQGLRKHYDYILIDCAAGVGEGLEISIEPADYIIIVAVADMLSIRDADRVASILEGYETKKVFLVINKINIDMMKKTDMIDIDTIINGVAVPLIGAVPEDGRIAASVNNGTPAVLFPKFNAGAAFYNIARRITGTKVPILKMKRKRLFKWGAK